MDDDKLCTMILAAAFRVHSRLGPGLLESVYQRVLAYELTKGGLSTEVQKSIQIVYDELVFEEGYRADLIVENRVLLELKSRFQRFNRERPCAIVAQQHISDSRNQQLSHRTFTRAISRPVGSKVWHAHAMQGSNECTVRSNSRGRSGSATGFRISEAS